MNWITKNLIFSFAVSCLIILSSCSSFNKIRLVQDGRSDFQIVISQNATQIEEHAANEFRKFIQEISGASLPIVTDSIEENEFEILIGKSNRLQNLLPEFDFSSLENDGFAIKTIDKKLIIIGGKSKGTLYGVYSFLEDYLGCRKYSAKVSFIPKSKSIIILQINDTQVPFIKHREAHFPDPFVQDYADWHKLDSRPDREKEWGFWVHTFERLIPPEKYFESHPEYFSLLGGRRISNGQLCLTNPGIYPILVDALKKFVQEKPGAHYWSVSQNDNYNECQCENCLRSNQKYEASAGTMLEFVNKVAGEFPDKTISTLAYQYTRKAPMGIKPAKNVNIMLCSIECNRSQSIATDLRSETFRKDIEDWGKLTDNILMWDYVVQFRNLVSPFPNLRVLQPNIKFFVKNNVRMMFQQGCGGNIGEFSELRAYIIAKLLWNPDANVDAIMDDFFNGYYGAAGKHIRTYIDIMHNALKNSGDNLDIYGYPYDGIDSYLTPELIKTYSKIFDDAEQATINQPESFERVKIARLPLEFAILNISLRIINDDLSYFNKSTDNWQVKPDMRRRLNNFVDLAKKAGIVRLEEHGTSPDDYKQSVEQQLKVSVKGNLAYGKPVKLLTQHSEKYPVGGGIALTNGLHGPNDYHCNWLGFEDEHLEAIIDLEAAQPIHRIKTNFLQQWYAWIWLPVKVEFYLSEDGENFAHLTTIQNSIPDTEPGAFTKVFDAEANGKQARFIKVFAQSRLKCPEWHIGAGGKAWIFVDEIVVE
jgi:hypothetical protein